MPGHPHAPPSGGGTDQHATTRARSAVSTRQALFGKEFCPPQRRPPYFAPDRAVVPPPLGGAAMGNGGGPPSPQHYSMSGGVTMRRDTASALGLDLLEAAVAAGGVSFSAGVGAQQEADAAGGRRGGVGVRAGDGRRCWCRRRYCGGEGCSLEPSSGGRRRHGWRLERRQVRHAEDGRLAPDAVD